MTTLSREQLLFAIMAETNNKFCFAHVDGDGRYNAFLNLVPFELLMYMADNCDNCKVITRLTCYLYLTMDPEFNQHLIESERETYSNIPKFQGINFDRFMDCINNIMANLDDELRCYERKERMNGSQSN